MSDRKSAWVGAVAVALCVVALVITEVLQSELSRARAEHTAPAAQQALSLAHSLAQQKRYENATEMLDSNERLSELLSEAGESAHLTLNAQSKRDFYLLLYNIDLGESAYGILSVRETPAGVVTSCGAYTRDESGISREADARLGSDINCENGVWEPEL